MLLTADDQVVEDSDVEKRQRLLQAFGDLAVGFAGLRVAGRVVVEEDDSDRVELQGTLGDDPGVNVAGIGRAGEEVLGGQDVVLGVEEDDAENFVTQMCAAGDKVAGGLLGTVDAALPLEATLQDGSGSEQDAFLVHLELVLGLQVLGALHRFFSTSATGASREPTGEASGPTAPGSEHRGSGRREGPQQSASVEEEARPCGRDSEAKVPLRGPVLVETALCMPPPRLADQAAFGWTG